MGLCQSPGRNGANCWKKIIMLKKISTVKNLKNKIVLLRVDFNVPLKNGKVSEDSRIVASLPTINYLRKQKARVLIMAHLGRPGGIEVKELSLKPVAKVLSTKIKQAVNVVNLAEAKKNLAKLKPGQIMMLENTRFLAGEEKNDPALSKELASLGDIFVFDGFAVAHRAAVSVSGIAKYLPTYAGLLMTSEVENLTTIMQKPKRPFVAIVGGAKMETKIPVLKTLVKSADQILIGGGIVNTILLARGYGIGNSLHEKDLMKAAKAIAKNKKIILPVDVVVGDKAGQNWRVVDLKNKAHEICGKGEAIFDIGPATIALFGDRILKAKSVLWNGAVGWFEQSPYNQGTDAIASLLATSKAFTVAGGGETVEVLEAQKLTKKINFISTGGGAMLEFISGKKLPGVQILAAKK